VGYVRNKRNVWVTLANTFSLDSCQNAPKFTDLNVDALISHIREKTIDIRVMKPKNYRVLGLGY